MVAGAGVGDADESLARFERVTSVGGLLGATATGFGGADVFVTATAAGRFGEAGFAAG